MGVPVITLRGDRFCARMSHSLLHQVGLSHLSAASREAYIATAVTLAEDLEALQVLRGTLRDRMVSSSICDASRATLELENAYRRAWADYCHS
jgi:predicted O-linked N-acetylglucosamine transferase (SPINDLY family)